MTTLSGAGNRGNELPIDFLRPRVLSGTRSLWGCGAASGAGNTARRSGACRRAEGARDDTRDPGTGYDLSKPIIYERRVNKAKRRSWPAFVEGMSSNTMEEIGVLLVLSATNCKQAQAHGARVRQESTQENARSAAQSVSCAKRPDSRSRALTTSRLNSLNCTPLRPYSVDRFAASSATIRT